MKVFGGLVSLLRPHSEPSSPQCSPNPQQQLRSSHRQKPMAPLACFRRYFGTRVPAKRSLGKPGRKSAGKPHGLEGARRSVT